jgi:hypothetical protein
MCNILKKTLITFLLLTPAVTMSQTKIYVNPLNLPAGYSKQIGNTVIYADALNLPAAYEQKVGATSIWSDGLNLPMGAVTTYNTQPYERPSKYETIYDQR